MDTQNIQDQIIELTEAELEELSGGIQLQIIPHEVFPYGIPAFDHFSANLVETQVRPENILNGNGFRAGFSQF